VVEGGRKGSQAKGWGAQSSALGSLMLRRVKGRGIDCSTTWGACGNKEGGSGTTYHTSDKDSGCTARNSRQRAQGGHHSPMLSLRRAKLRRAKGRPHTRLRR
jgi:hypothetical protein